MPVLRNLDKLTDSKKAERILALRKRLEADREPFVPIYEEICQLALPQMADWTMEASNFGDQAKDAQADVYDTTLQTAVERASDGMYGYVNPEHSPWFRLGLQSKDQENAPGARVFLQDTEEALYGELARSDFYTSMGELYRIALSIGTATMYMEPTPDGNAINFTCMHPREIVLHENAAGVADTHNRKYWMCRDDLVYLYGDKLSDDFKKAADEHPYEELLVQQHVGPRMERDIRYRDNQNMAFGSYKVLEAGDKEKGAVLLEESGYPENPYTTLRFLKIPGEQYGRSWGWSARPLALRLNQVAYTLLKGAHKAVEPSVQYPADMDQEDIDLEPDGRIPYQDPRRLIVPVQTMGQYPVGRDQEEDLRQMIREIYMLPFWLTLSQQMTRERTATESWLLQGERAAILVSVANRVYVELLIPVLAKTWAMASRAGRMPKVPESLMQAGGMKVSFIGPLAQILKRYLASQGINQTLSQLLPLAVSNGGPGPWPDVLELIDGQELGRHILNEGNFPQRAVRSVAEVRRRQAEKMKAIAKQQAVENLNKMAPALSALPSLSDVVAQPGLPGGVPVAGGGR